MRIIKLLQAAKRQKKPRSHTGGDKQSRTKTGTAGQKVIIVERKKHAQPQGIYIFKIFIFSIVTLGETHRNNTQEIKIKLAIS